MPRTRRDRAHAYTPSPRSAEPRIQRRPRNPSRRVAVLATDSSVVSVGDIMRLERTEGGWCKLDGTPAHLSERRPGVVRLQMSGYKARWYEVASADYDALFPQES